MVKSLLMAANYVKRYCGHMCFYAAATDDATRITEQQQKFELNDVRLLTRTLTHDIIPKNPLTLFAGSIAIL
jgi:nitrogen-specific signal transduction histidine kinase